MRAVVSAMSRFVLTSRWRVETSAERAWQLLTDVERWPRWWRYARCVRVVERGGADHAGDVTLIDWSSALLYRIRLRMVTTRVERARELEARADGDLSGSGLWLLEPVDGPAVDITYRWEVTLQRPWMRHLAFLLRPLFEWNHFVVMRAGARGMARELGCGLSHQREFSAFSRRP